MAPESIKKYFYDLDQQIFSQISSTDSYFGPLSAYEATSLTIEIRAIQIYQIYEKILREVNHDLTIEPLIKEEEKHLDHFSKLSVQNHSTIEGRCFKKLLGSIEADLL
jgi:hypothetical protein